MNDQLQQIQSMLEQLVKMQAANNAKIEEMAEEIKEMRQDIVEMRQDIAEIKQTQERHERILEILSLKSIEAESFMKHHR